MAQCHAAMGTGAMHACAQSPILHSQEDKMHAHMHALARVREEERVYVGP